MFLRPVPLPIQSLRHAGRRLCIPSTTLESNAFKCKAPLAVQTTHDGCSSMSMRHCFRGPRTLVMQPTRRGRPFSAPFQLLMGRLLGQVCRVWGTPSQRRSAHSRDESSRGSRRGNESTVFRIDACSGHLEPCVSKGSCPASRAAWAVRMAVKKSR